MKWKRNMRRRSVLYDGLADSSENVDSRHIKEEADMKKYSPWTWSRLEQLSIINFLQTHGGFSPRKTGKIWEKLEEMQICPGRSAMACKYQFNRHPVLWPTPWCESCLHYYWKTRRYSTSFYTMGARLVFGICWKGAVWSRGVLGSPSSSDSGAIS